MDAACEIKNVKVMHDFSAVLVLEDISYNQISQVKVFKMQLFERNDKQKWYVWVAQGMIPESEFSKQNEDDIDASELNTKFEEFYDRINAQAQFEKLFFQKTANKWTEKDFFKGKPGKFNLLNKDKNKQVLLEAQEVEKELTKIISENDVKFECTLDVELKTMMETIFDLKAMKAYLTELGLDVERMPLGKLTPEKVKRGHNLLCEIQRLVVSDENRKHLSMLVALSNDLYCAVPHFFGIKKPPTIDHLVRIKEKTRLLE